ncbi:helix-turn-helix domain-containing protein [Kribbella sandramycini]|uniref:Helix-turn-helix domain-containing protein n=1 Tax=Kribbella sandramycini TaxID=60450 RepID=A0A7Y4KW97_9ACTN|nr:MarR family transcriptional regulator [Kribbella sandramycini]MBB6567549.1 putative transcriptional regulator [Kribbella sandramycini]NOL39847.1 helix-turn-helix domain-containing protein [Kribbella sandramycini]
MPGGRLSQTERRAIASGLGDGLGYAEIARQLERPTSTVSREVARNGGARGYRADHAHYATSSRARRRRPRPQAVLDERAEYAEQFAAIMVDGGLPRMAARVLARLYTADGRSVTAAQLAEALQVSPASISKAIGYLEQVGLLHREADPQRRLQHYVIAADVWQQAWQVSSDTNLGWAEIAAKGVTLFGADSAAGHRLGRMATFFQQLADDMSGGAGFQVVDDALSVFAVVRQSGRLLDAEQLAGVLGWPLERVEAALEIATPARLSPEQLARADRGAAGR